MLIHHLDLPIFNGQLNMLKNASVLVWIQLHTFDSAFDKLALYRRMVKNMSLVRGARCSLFSETGIAASIMPFLLFLIYSRTILVRSFLQRSGARSQGIKFCYPLFPIINPQVINPWKAYLLFQLYLLKDTFWIAIAIAKSPLFHGTL